jgi:Zn-dependent M28 family amino/carboxypeptidase
MKKIFALLPMLFLFSFTLCSCQESSVPASFDGEQAYEYARLQLEFGPRPVGSPAHALLVDWLQEELGDLGWQVALQQSEVDGEPITNVLAKRGEGAPWIIFGAHYDTRLRADREGDAALKALPVPGANDGASGVAVLLELARTLPAELPGSTWLVFFDAEDNGRIEGRDWILGSRAFVETLEGKPDAVVVVDMVGDADLQIYWEQGSDAGLREEIWGQAAALGYADHLIALPRHRMVDDHVPFLLENIPAVLLIDFDYPYWHTTADTLDKISAASLQIVGETLRAWRVAKTVR